MIGVMYYYRENLMSLRSFLYLAARLLGDWNAIKSGTVGRRIARRIVGRATGRMLGKLFR